MVRMARAVIAAYFLPVAVFAAQNVDGHVVDAVTGADVAGADVILFDFSGISRNGPYRATTDGRGRFLIEDVADGAYRVTYRAKGYWSPYDSGDNSQPVYTISSAASPLHLEQRLQPIPRLSGRVVDPDGKPVPNSHVWLMQQAKACYSPSCFTFMNELITERTGEFSTADFQGPGTWIVAARPPISLEPPRSSHGERLTWVQTFYPGVQQPEAAVPLSVRAGVTFPFLEIKLVAATARRIRGRVLDPQGRPVPKLALELHNGFGHIVPQTSGDDGAFEFLAVSSAEWHLSATIDRDSVRLWAVQPIQPGDRDVDDIVLHLQSPILINGRFVFEHPDGAPHYSGHRTDIVATRESDAFNRDPVPAAPLGHVTAGFTFNLPLYPGRYTFSMLEPPEPPYYIDSIRLGELSALTADGVSVTSADQPLTILLKYGGGTVRGVVENCNGGRAVLLPADPALLNQDFIRDARCGPNGQFEIPSLRPGDYFGFAVTSQAAMDWWTVLSDDAIKPQATRITVRDGETTQADIRLLHF